MAQNPSSNHEAPDRKLQLPRASSCRCEALAESDNGYPKGV